ncbi:MAG: dCTP deaminase [Candidatus Portnoybacteria bacterium]|nr:dCTP deaminase [Candidatus Portnoybacteria bacterium]
MATLSKKGILNLIKEGKIIFEPSLDQFQIQPNSIDLRTGWNFYIPKTWELTGKGRVALNIDYLNYNFKAESFKIIRLTEGQYFEILPGEFVVVSTYEKIKINTGNIMGILFARSSTIRRGLIVESGTIDSRYEGFLMLPLLNNTRDQIIKIYPGERICQIIFHQLDSELTLEEACMHGISKAKYLESTAYGLQARSDSEEEIDFIKMGKIEDLKNQYKVQ